MQFEIIYPERRTISAATIDFWFSDAVANDAIAEDRLYIRDHETQAKAEALQDAGLITLAQAPAK